ncbi:alpha/beta fold hydrolase [Microvirga pudoricolor]|uniref:alpha/beta fold hydrolase n=1 Tax=Microvirga pudoricolor TaxID=2778729 RepID=UPI00195264A5|nr:alpha/beta fold hydrolase [Microvirga pudoricolor]MBM6596105.1 alpha/beta fold hydrolase [Microvirga pudoricolor]
MVGALEPHFAVRAVPLPNALDHDYRTLAEAYASTLPDRPVLLVGESFSGPLVAMIAERRPDVVVGTVFLSTFARLHAPRALVRALLAVPFRHLPMRLISWAMKGKDETLSLRDKLAESLRQAPEPLLKHRIRLALAVDVRDLLTRLPVPMLVVHGRKDRIVWPWQTRVFRKARPDCRIVSLDGPHMLLEAKPGEVASAIRSFIADLADLAAGGAAATLRMQTAT